MNVNEVLQKVDECYDRHQGQEAEKLMQDAIREAMAEGDDESLLQLLNELLGYYRETSQAEHVNALAGQCIGLVERMGLQDTIPYATTLLNVANAYRAVGRLEDSLELYRKVRGIYERTLDPDHMFVAGLENNMSLLYQEMGNFRESRECLLKALRIAERKEDAEFETAVSHANLAGTCLQLGEAQEAYAHARQAVDAFEKMHVEDAHHAAALSALATYYYQKEDYAQAIETYERAMGMIEKNLGRNESYRRLEENRQACLRAMQTETERQPRGESGMELCRAYYEAYGRPMIAEKFPAYEPRIAVGLVGKGSDCFGWDDAQSRDHDWGPDFCMWVTEETYAEIGEALKQAYEELPAEFRGYRRVSGMQERGRRGVFTINGFFDRLVGAPEYEQINWQQVPDYALASVVNGEIFRDEEGIFTAKRDEFKKGYPEAVRYLRMADSAARFSQCGQYNYRRVSERGDGVMANIMLADCMREAMKLQHYIEGKYPPHDKWLCRSLRDSEDGRKLEGLLGELADAAAGADTAMLMTRSEGARSVFIAGRNGGEPGIADRVEQIAEFLMKELYSLSFISDSDTYLDAHSEELAQKSAFAACKDERLVEWIAEAEFEAFDKVKNHGGRADCQNDWPTFSIMRKSQYMTWNRTMLIQYLYDFFREFQKGHNLIEEKYGRMMESTAPEEYEEIKDHFPEISAEKKTVIEQIVRMQVEWMEEFAGEYPALADNARSVRTSEDNIANTSYETYLRGEISTYSDKMLELYGRYVVEYAKAGKNLAFEIMTNSVHLYGYKDLHSAERFLER